MSNAEWIELFHVIPLEDHCKLVVVLQNGTEFSVDTLCKLEPNYLVMRGRMGGTIEEARGIFIPYDQMLCLRLERIMKLEEMTAMCGNPAAVPDAPVRAGAIEPTPTKSPTPLPVAPNDPAAASRLLMDKIRANRAANKTGSPS